MSVNNRVAGAFLKAVRDAEHNMYVRRGGDQDRPTEPAETRAITNHPPRATRMEGNP